MAVDILPVTGDFDGNGVDTVALVDLSGQKVSIYNSHQTGKPDQTYRWREITPTSIPVAGDWNGDGVDTIGIYDSATGQFILRTDPGVETTRARFSITGAPLNSTPLAGDWNADGKDDVALWSAGTKELHVSTSLTTSLPSNIINFADVLLGFSSDVQVIAGNFVAPAGDDFAFVSATDAKLFARSLASEAMLTQTGIFVPSASGETFDLFLAGDWDANGSDELGGYGFGKRVVAIADLITDNSPDAVYCLQDDAPPAPAVKASAANAITPLAVDPVIPLTPNEVKALLKAASKATASEDAIIAIVDQNGRILGVRIEDGVAPNIKNNKFLKTFAIDGAVAKARTAAFFASNGSPLTSRTIRSLSESTITEREVNSDPTVRNPNGDNPFTTTGAVSKAFGPGFVAPIGLGGHFPPGISGAPHVDLFGIERQSRDGLVSPGPDGVRGNADDIALPNRFNVPDKFIPNGKDLFTPDSYGVQTGTVPYAQGRGIANLPGGVPLYKFGKDGVRRLVGGIGVFFPGARGFASFEQNFKAKKGQDTYDRVNAPKVLEAEYIAVVAGGLVPALATPKIFLSPLSRAETLKARIDLVGIQLEVFGPRASQEFPKGGVQTLLDVGASIGPGADSGTDQAVTATNLKYIAGKPVASGWLVAPHNASDNSITGQAVKNIVAKAVAEAQITRAAIRFNSSGKSEPAGRTKMVIAVGDKQGNILGLFRMPDATIFSIDVAVAKARNTAYYADPTQLKNADKVDDSLLLNNYTAATLTARGALLNGLGTTDFYRNIAGTQPFNSSNGVALTNRTFRFLAGPRYPSGIDGTLPPIFSILNDHNIPQTIGVNPRTAENLGNSNAPAGLFESVMAWDSFHIMSNFRDDTDIANQNGIVFFPGSTPLYKGNKVVGGLGVSGDGVDQDDVVTFAGQQGLAPPTGYRADQTYYRGVRLPFQKFNRNPRG